MFKFLRNSLLHTHSTLPFRRPFSLKCSSDDSISLSFTVSYLVNSCGFSHESALAASKRVRFKIPRKPDSVLACFEDHGFSKSQTLLVIKRYPRLLTSHPEKTISPKLHFLHSKGLSRPEIARIVASNPIILQRSLENFVIPWYNFFKSLLRSDDKTIACFRRYPLFFTADWENHVKHSLNVLRSIGVPDSNIIYFLHCQPRMFRTSYRFQEIAEEIKEMGFDPSRITFMEAFKAMKSEKQSTWLRKVNAYKKWGWSEEDVLNAFRKRPRCMTLSKDKIAALMDFFVNKLGWNSLLLARHPWLLTYKLDTRIKPRASVLQFLFQRGLALKSFRSSSPYHYSDQIFLQRFVNPYLKQAPQLLEVYEQGLDSQIEQMKL